MRRLSTASSSAGLSCSRSPRLNQKTARFPAAILASPFPIRSLLLSSLPLRSLVARIRALLNLSLTISHTLQTHLSTHTHTKADTALIPQKHTCLKLYWANLNRKAERRPQWAPRVLSVNAHSFRWCKTSIVRRSPYRPDCFQWTTPFTY